LLELLVNALVPPFHHGKTSLLCIRYRKGLGQLRRINASDELLHLAFAKGAVLKRRSAQRPVQFEASPANPALLIGIVVDVFVEGHGREI
jgi:hypothetical protein